SLKLFQRNHVSLAERSDPAAAQRRDVAQGSERPAEIAGQRAYIGALATFGRQHGMVRVGHFNEFEAINLDRARLKLDNFAVAGKVVGPLAIDLDGGKTRRNLFDGAGKARQ